MAGNPRRMAETARRPRRLALIYEYVTRLPASGQRSVSRAVDVPDRAGWTVALASVSVPALTFVPVYASGRLPGAGHAPHATVARPYALALAPARPCARPRSCLPSRPGQYAHTRPAHPPPRGAMRDGGGGAAVGCDPLRRNILIY